MNWDWLKSKPRNRRLGQEGVLEVKLRSDQIKATRMRIAVAAASVCFGTLFGLYVLWRSGEWLLDRMVYSNPAFAIREIDVETDGVIKLDQLRRWARVREGENLMALDLSRVKRDLEIVSAIRSVAVERELPNILHLRVSERVPAATIEFLVQSRAGVVPAKYYLDEEGFVFKPLDPRQLQNFTNSVPADLPQLCGFKSLDIVAGRRLESEQIRSALRLIDLHECSSMGAVTALKTIDVSYPQALVVTTTDGGQVTFGCANLEQQLLRWRVVFDLARSNQLGIFSLDLSVTNNVPARWVKLDPSQPAKPPIRRNRTTPPRRNV
jgi:cell division septal protein FtsQ